MASKRRVDNLAEGPKLKRDRSTNHDVIDAIKSETDDEYAFEVKAEHVGEEDEKPVICEVPVEETDDFDPLEPLEGGEVKQEVRDEIKPEDGGEQNIPQDESPAVEPELRSKSQESIPAKQVILKKSSRNPRRANLEIDLGGHRLSKSQLKLPKCSEESDFFLELLANTDFFFGDRTIWQQNDVVLASRPTPCLKPDCESRDRFWPDVKEYWQIPWLTGSKKLGKHYCWPCLLFTRERMILTPGYSEEEFWKAIESHESNPLHNKAYEALLIRQAELGITPEKIDPDQAEIVKINRKLLELLIQILCSKKTKLHNTDSDFDGYEELMKLAISYDEEMSGLFGNQLNEDSLIDFVSRHAKNVLASIHDKISAKILEEISNAQFISIIYEDTESAVDRKTKVAVIVRYMAENGDVCERFVRFAKIGTSRNAYDVLEIHSDVVEGLGTEKLVGITCSGTVIDPSCVDEFKNLVKKASPKANFFNHPDNNFKEILLQSLSHLEDCRKFFEVISNLVKFLTTNVGAIPTLITFIKFNNPDCKLTAEGDSFTIGIISTIRLYYSHILQFFFKVSKKFWNDEVAKHAPIFMKFLQDPFNRFLIVIIASVLDTVDNLSQIMEKEFSLSECKTEAVAVLEKLKALRTNGPKHFPQLAGEEGINKLFPETFSKIIDLAMKCVLNRVLQADVLNFKFPCSTVSDILQAPEIWGSYGRKFDSLKEFKALMNFMDLHKELFKDKPMADIVKAVCTKEVPTNISAIWAGFLRFCALAILPPKSVPSVPSAVLRLKSYLKDKQRFNATDTMMFLEADRLRSLATDPHFIDDVINHYAVKTNNPNFVEELEEKKD